MTGEETNTRLWQMIRAHLRTNFLSGKRRTETISLREDKASLGECLTEIERLEAVRLVDREVMEIYPDIEISLNGVDFYFLPEKMETEIADGDTISISLITLGGG